MSTPRILTLRIAIAALIWASALLAPAAAAPITIQHPAHDGTSATATAAPAAYRDNTPDSGPSTPGPTDPNGPAF